MKAATPRAAVPPRLLYALALGTTAAIFAFDLSTPLDSAERQLYLVPMVLLWWAPSPHLLYAAGLITLFMAVPAALPFVFPLSFPLPAVPETEMLLNSAVGISLVWAGAYLLVRQRRGEESRIRSLRRLELMTSTAGELLRAPKPQEAMDALCRRVMEHLDCHVFINFLMDGKKGMLRLNAWAGIPREEARKIEWLECGAAVCGCVARDRSRIVLERIPSTSDERAGLVKSYGVKAYACIPLLGAEGEMLGTLSFGTRSRETFREEELSLMKAVADHVAVAMTRLKDEDALRESLAEKDNLTPNDEDALLNAAFAAAYHWAQVGAPVNHARADLTLAHAFSRLAQKKENAHLAPEAMRYARRCLNFFNTNPGEDWDMAFAHAEMAYAAAVSGDKYLHSYHYQQANRLGENIVEQEDRKVFLDTLKKIPRP